MNGPSAHLAMLFLLFSSVSAFAQCGQEPPLSDTTMKAELNGKAQLATKFLGDASFGSKVEATRTEAISRYPAADKLLASIYYKYVLCNLIFNDKSMTTPQKIEAWSIANGAPPKQSRLMIQSDGLFVDNRSIGDVYADRSNIEFQIDGGYVGDMALNTSFDGITETLPQGQHVFTYKVDIKAKSGIRIRGSCSVKFLLDSDKLYSPYIAFAPFDENKGVISKCALRQSSTLATNKMAKMASGYRRPPPNSA